MTSWADLTFYLLKTNHAVIKNLYAKNEKINFRDILFNLES